MKRLARANGPATLAAYTEKGVTWVDSRIDAAFRKALVDLCPSSQVRARMHEALAQVPQKGAALHSVRYFGAELKDILKRTAPLVDELHWYLHHDKNLPNFKQWLEATNFANEYRMIKALVAWAEHMKSVPDSEKLKWPVH